jgi:hypothetical protein
VTEFEIYEIKTTKSLETVKTMGIFSSVCFGNGKLTIFRHFPTDLGVFQLVT